MSDIVAGLLGVLVHYLVGILTFILLILLTLFVILILASLCVLIGTLLGQGIVAAGKFFGAGRDV
jgi:hypothetical protein